MCVKVQTNINLSFSQYGSWKGVSVMPTDQRDQMNSLQDQTFICASVGLYLRVAEALLSAIMQHYINCVLITTYRR